MTRADYRNLLKRYAHYAPRYDRRFAKYSNATLRQALEVIPESGAHAMLDVACGTGLFAAMVRAHRPDLEITGVDVSPDMLDKARQRIPPAPGNHVRWLHGFAEDLPLSAEQFDIVTCTNAFHLVQNSGAALQEFLRVLKPGGTLILVDWCLDFPFMKVRDAVLRISDRQKRKIRRLQQLTAELQSAGFEVAKAERFRTGTWGLMCVVAQRPDVVPTHLENRMLDHVQAY